MEDGFDTTKHQNVNVVDEQTKMKRTCWENEWGENDKNSSEAVLKTLVEDEN